MVFRIFETMKLPDQQIDWMEVSSNTVYLFQLLHSLLVSGGGGGGGGVIPIYTAINHA